LKYKTLLISQVSQKIFNLNLLVDKLEKEKYQSLINRKVKEHFSEVSDINININRNII
jgi:hypothetical protein